MRLMRPGSCVGPQQHFLYENQLEWVKWSARDELLRELKTSQPQPQSQEVSEQEKERERSRSCSAQPPRPITPPNETELARNRSTTPHHQLGNAPVTPRRQIVPGQPRKTPGRSKHGVAAPEEKDSPAIVDASVEEGGGEKMQEDELVEEDEEEKVLREEEEMEGVILTSSPRKKRTSLSAEKTRASPRKSLQLVADDDKEEEEDPSTTMPSPKKLDLQPSATTQPLASTSNNRPKTPSTSTSNTSRPTRIARSAAVPSNPAQTHQRALSAITDNRIVDRLRTNPSTRSSGGGATTTAQQQAIARSRGAKNLANVFEAHEQDNKEPSSTTTTTRSSSRYPLRNTGGRTSPNPSSSTASTNPVAPNSPSKLPTRIPAKRQPPASPTHQSGGFDPSHAGKEGKESGASGFSLKGALDKLGGGAKGRNVRRRRSSMGSQDFVQAG